MHIIALQYSTFNDTLDFMEVNLLSGVQKCACCVVTAFYKTAEQRSCSLDKCEVMCLPLSLNISIRKQLPSPHAKTSKQYGIYKPHRAPKLHADIQPDKCISATLLIITYKTSIRYIKYEK